MAESPNDAEIEILVNGGEANSGPHSAKAADELAAGVIGVDFEIGGDGGEATSGPDSANDTDELAAGIFSSAEGSN